jgi:hypothetical protein
MSTTTELQPATLDDDPGSLPWNIWLRDALQQGMDPELARLGARAMRSAHLRHWPEGLRYLSNFNLMTRLGLEAPELAGRLWELLLETEGLTWISGADNGTGHGIIDFRVPDIHTR